MRPRRAPAILVGAAFVAAVATGCGGGGTTATTVAQPIETVDAPAHLPPGWTTPVNRISGFSVGVPPGWETMPQGVRSRIRSPDHLVVVTITADRTDAALNTDLNGYAETAVKQRGFTNLKAGQAQPLETRYDAVKASASGHSTKTGVQQDLELVAMRRDHLATYAILIARNAKLAAHLYQRELNEMVQSLRGRPVEVPATGP